MGDAAPRCNPLPFHFSSTSRSRIAHRTAASKLLTRLRAFGPLAFCLLLLALGTPRALAGGINLAWDGVSNPALVGYIVYYGPAAGSYVNKIDVGNRTSYYVSNLSDGALYHFAVTAYDASRVESSFSNDAAATVNAAAPVANFTASVTSGVAPLAMNFTSTSTGSIAGYAWTFGDGTTSTSPSPGHVYSAPGVYTVSLTVTGSAGSSTKTMPNYVTVTGTGDGTPPGAPGALAAAASGTTINLAWQAATDNVAVTGYRVERCDGSACTAFVQIATTATTSFADANRVAGGTSRYRVRATDAAGNLGSYSNIAAATAGASTAGALAGTVAGSSQTVDMTAVGTSDWVLWASKLRKASGGSQVTTYATVGGTATSYTGDPRLLGWTDGSPYPLGNSNAGLSLSSANGAFQFSVPADATTRRLVVYVGAQAATGTLRARLSDGSSPDYVASHSATGKRADAVVTLTYRAASAGQRLTVTWTKDSKTSGNVSLQGAALAVVSAPSSAAAVCPCSVWPASAVPATPDVADTSPVELGVRFRSDVSGVVTGVRFYKSSANGGTHTGSLWRADGTLLARATYANETASGWQQVNFSQPVAIAANTTYVMSYHTNAGHYAGDNRFFTNAGVDNGVLHLLRDGADGGNGVFAYGTSSSFPVSTYSGTNYWVDVVFVPSP